MKKYLCLSFRGPVYLEPSPGGVSSALTAITNKYHFPWIFCRRKNDGRISSDKLNAILINNREWENYYLGACNSTLWPLFHQTYVKPIYNESSWDIFEKINKRFAELAVKVANKTRGVKGFFVNDYQLLLIGKYLRKSLGNKKKLVFFLHIPWPKNERILSSPWGKRIVNSLLSYDIVTFQTSRFCLNFLQVIGQLYPLFPVEQTKNNEYQLKINKRKLKVRWVPIGIDYLEFRKRGNNSKKRSSPKTKIILGADRLDYIKGIPRKIKWFGEFLLKNPKYQERISLTQIIPPTSRIGIKTYDRLRLKINEITKNFNRSLGTKKWSPMILISKTLGQKELISFYRRASVCIISSLHDGMNLIAKEFVATNHDRPVSLLLSSKCGASDQLQKGAFIFNPYSKTQFFSALNQALKMSEKEKCSRVLQMADNIKKENVYWWVKRVLR